MPIFGPNRDANGESRRLHNEEFHSSYHSPNIFRAGHVARMEESRSDLHILTGKTTRRIALGKHRRRWEDNIRIDL